MRLWLSTGQGAMNVGLAVACCVMALSGPLGNVDKWLPLILSDQGRALDSLVGQLSDGSLILRITTTFVTVTAILRYVTQLRTVAKNEAPTAGLWRQMRQLNLTNAQGGIFLSALTIMWLLQGHGVPGAWPVILSYAFAFFVDDWIIISEYRIKLDVSSLPLHKWRLRLGYLCLAIPSLALAWNEFGRWGVVVMVWFFLNLIVVSLAHRRANEADIWPQRKIPQQQSEEALADRDQRSGDGSLQA
ncbi:hypothetical protein GCM10009647_047050 [Streptomyces sanglieri]